MEATVYLKNVHISPKKLRFLLPAVKGMTPVESLEHLYYAPQKGARIFYKAIKSAIDNAKYTLKVNENLLKFKLFTIEQGNVLKRYRPGGRGTAKPYRKKFSHIKIVLIAENVKPVAKVKEVKKETKDVKLNEGKKELKVEATKKKVVKAAANKAKQEQK